GREQVRGEVGKAAPARRGRREDGGGQHEGAVGSAVVYAQPRVLQAGGVGPLQVVEKEVVVVRGAEAARRAPRQQHGQAIGSERGGIGGVHLRPQDVADVAQRR